MAVLLIYVLASTALGLALTPALWAFRHPAAWSDRLPAPLSLLGVTTSAALCFFLAGPALLGA
jgi:hypothetical protein